MSMSHFDNIRVVLAEPNSELRAGLKDSLHDIGFKNVQATGNLSQIVTAVKAGEADLLIADTTLPEGDFNKFVYELRHGCHGDNPFLVVITLINKPSRDVVQAAINSGADQVLAKPITAKGLTEKVAELTHSRKRFVVTTDYVGPDRRAAHREGTMQIPQIDVPNPLHQRMSGSKNDSRNKRSVEAAKLIINEHKVQRHAYQIGWLLDHVMPEIAALQADALPDGPENLKRLHNVSQDLCRRIKGTRFAHVTEMALTLCRMSEQALNEGLCENDMHLMGRMAEIIERAFDPDREATAAEYNRRSGVRGINVFKEEEPKDLAATSLAPKDLATVMVN
ncbi:response regulator [Magnetovibrio sp.]|uniref:response regulator n=1 Tax=Magnetovibrio sp. TaxID=2024836 RepID=UPI002F952F16